MLTNGKILAVIPARWGSTRFPGKPIVDILGKPMIQWVSEQALKANLINEVVIATDDKRIYDVVFGFGGKAIMTSSSHQSGTDRVAEIAKNVECDIVVNVQGDEPLIPVDYINMLAELLIENKDADVATLAHSISNQKDKQDPNLVKVVFDKWHNAIYFSRCQIPYNGKEFFGHIGIYAYRKKTLEKFTNLEQSENEKKLKLEQLRALDNNIAIKLLITDFKHRSIDVKEDLKYYEI